MSHWRFSATTLACCLFVPSGLAIIPLRQVAPPVRNLFLPNLHVRYDAARFLQDLMF